MNQFDLFNGEEPLFTASGEIRTCIKCETTLPIEFFDIDAYHANGDVRRRPECTDCRKKARMQTAKLKKVTAPRLTIMSALSACVTKTVSKAQITRATTHGA